MGKFIDFIIEYNPDPEKLGKQILQNITVNRLKAKKPCVIFIGGDSGEGKSTLGLKILDVVNKAYGVKTLEVLNDQVVYLPVEYLTKLDAILHWNDKKINRPDLKNVHAIMIDEAREVVRAKDWFTFLNRAISDCNAMARRIKPLVLIIISQFVKDVDREVRYTFTFYVECTRPLSGRTRITFERIWKNTFDLERPKLCKRPLVGFIKEDQDYSKFYPKFEVKLPPKDIWEMYDKTNFEAKSRILRKRIEETIKKMEKQVNIFDKVDSLVKFYISHPDQLTKIMDPRYKKGFRLRTDFKDMHDLTKTEIDEFEVRFYKEGLKKDLFRDPGDIEA